MKQRTRSEKPTFNGWRAWFFGLLLLAALFAAVGHWGEIERFTFLARQTRPGWLALALALQLFTYVCVANGWHAVLLRAGTPSTLAPLMRIAVTKLFADQVLPTAGIGGNVLLVDQLRRIGVSSSTSVAALLLSMVGYYAAYGLFAVAMLVMLWLHDQATPLMAGLVTIFLVVALGIPGLALWLRHRGSRPLPRRLERIAFMRYLLEAIGKAPSQLLRDRTLIAQVTGWNALIFLADAATFFACLHGLGEDTSFATAFIALIMASMVVTLGPIPLGLGSFEATATATLRLLGVPFEAAVTATLLLRLLTLWLPLLPGLVLMRKALRKSHRSPPPTHPLKKTGSGTRRP